MGATGVGGLDLLGGYVVFEWVNAQALDKLVLRDQLSVIVSRSETCRLRCETAVGQKQKWNTHVVQHRSSRSRQLQHRRGIEMEMPVWAQCYMTLPIDPRVLKGLKTVFGRVLSHVDFMLLVRAGLSCIPLAVVAFSSLCHTGYQHACANTSSLAPATVPPRIRRSDALQRIFTATARLCSQSRLIRSSGQQDKPSLSGLHPHIDRGFGQRLAVSWQHWLDGSFGGCPLRKVAAHETKLNFIDDDSSRRSRTALVISPVNIFEKLFFKEDETSTNWLDLFKRPVDG